MELWDIYDRDRVKTGRLQERGKEMNPDDYHLVVQIWIQNSEGKWLISKRSPEKWMAGKWEATGGSVVAGEDTFTAALREVREELGIVLDASTGELISSTRYDYPRWKNPGFIDVYMFRGDYPIESVKLQEGETCAAKWATTEEIHGLRARGELYPGSHEIPKIGGGFCRIS